MAINTSALFATGERLVNDAVKSAGTTVQFATVTSDIDPDTRTTTETVTVLYEPPAIVTTSGATSGATELLPGVVLKESDLRIVLMANTDDVPDGTRVTVTKCRDRRFLGITAKVLGTARNSSGAVHMVYARPGTPNV